MMQSRRHLQQRSLAALCFLPLPARASICSITTNTVVESLRPLSLNCRNTMFEESEIKSIESLERIRWDVWLAAAVVGLVFFGVVMVYSASAGQTDASGYLWT